MNIVKTLLISLLFCSSISFAEPKTASSYYSTGRQTNATADTILADTGPLTSGGFLGANYEVSIILNGSIAMAYKLEILNSLREVTQTTYLSAPANQATIIDLRATFFVPNGYAMRIRNDTGAVLGATIQASLAVKIQKLVDR